MFGEQGLGLGAALPTPCPDLEPHTRAVMAPVVLKPTCVTTPQRRAKLLRSAKAAVLSGDQIGGHARPLKCECVGVVRGPQVSRQAQAAVTVVSTMMAERPVINHAQRYTEALTACIANAGIMLIIRRRP